MKNYLLKIIALFSFLIVLSSCDKEDEIAILEPSITSETTSENVEITYTTIKISGNVSSDGGSEITARGVCWSTNLNPTIDDNKTIEDANAFTSLITDLVANTTYYFRVYATNSAGTSYGVEQSFTTATLDATTWDFFVVYSSTVSWHADVTFNADGTTVYDEPAVPGTYLAYGTWDLDGNTLTYVMDASRTDNSFHFTGTLLNNKMSGTFTYGTYTDRTWDATMY